MLNLSKQFRWSSFRAVARDPQGSLVRFWEQYTASREGPTPPELYPAEVTWEHRLHRLMEDESSRTFVSEFWDLWASVLEELDAKGIKTGPESFKKAGMTAMPHSSGQYGL